MTVGSKSDILLFGRTAKLVRYKLSQFEKGSLAARRINHIYMFKSVFIKYVAAFMLICIVCMLMLTTITSSTITDYNTDVKTTTLENAANEISDYVYDKMSQCGTRRIKDYVGIYASNLLYFFDLMSVNVDDFVIFLADDNGKIVMSGGSQASRRYGGDDGLFDINEKKYYVPQGHMEILRSNGSCNEISTLEGIFDEDYIVYSVAQYDTDGDFVGAVVACSPSSGMNDLLYGMIKTIFMSTLWIILAMLVTSYFISERLVSPLRAMSRASKSFARGNFDTRVSVKGNDEVAQLASAFNDMATSLEKNEEMRSLFLANVSHDLRTPMTTISGFIDGILDGAIPPEKHEYYLGVIASEVRRLSRLVMTLLDITKIQAGERKFTMVPFDICELCRQVLISSEQRIDAKHLDVEFICDSDNMYVRGDVDAIHQIVYNLLDNAIKFSRDGGKYELSIKKQGSKIITSIYNEGEGISEDDLPFVFDRFYKSDRSRGLDKTGVGLGLFISKTIIDAHNETIKAESEYGKWCRFTFTMPATDPPAKKAPTSTDALSSPIGIGK